jgi:hypothetical protein
VVSFAAQTERRSPDRLASKNVLPRADQEIGAPNDTNTRILRLQFSKSSVFENKKAGIFQSRLSQLNLII